MIIGEDCDANFRAGDERTVQFFARLGVEPDFAGKTVLDVGCGTGNLAIYMARKGARRVVGIDIDEHRVEYARANLKASFPELSSTCEFLATNPGGLAERDFDIVTAQDTFEHVADIKGCMTEIAARIRPGGRLYAGFGPLYNSPWGDHGAFRLRIPWGHLILPERWLIAKLNKTRPEGPVQCVQELGLNKLSLTEYKAAISASGLQIADFKLNRNPHILSRIMVVLARWRPLSEYMTHAVFCVLEKPSDL